MEAMIIFHRWLNSKIAFLKTFFSAIVSIHSYYFAAAFQWLKLRLSHKWYSWKIRDRASFTVKFRNFAYHKSNNGQCTQ